MTRAPNTVAKIRASDGANGTNVWVANEANSVSKNFSWDCAFDGAYMWFPILQSAGVVSKR